MNTLFYCNTTPGSLRTAVIGIGLLIALTASATAKPGNGNGKGRGNSPDFVPPGLADKGGVPPGLRRAPVEVVVVKPPPALRIEIPLPRPSPKHIWVPGYWTWQTDAYVWAPGVWMLPPEPNAVWVEPRVEKRSGVSIYISGFWRL